MDRDIDASVGKALLDLLGEQSLSAYLRKRAIKHPVSPGGYHLDFNGKSLTMCGNEPVTGLMGLGEGQLRTAGSNPDQVFG